MPYSADFRKYQNPKQPKWERELKEKIIKIITGNTEYWQPHGKKDSCFIIEEWEPFFWRINPEWAEEVSGKILKLFATQRKQAQREITQDFKKIVEGMKKDLYNSPNFTEDPEWGYATLIKLLTLYEQRNKSWWRRLLGLK